jgi:hypothetical protein
MGQAADKVGRFVKAALRQLHGRRSLNQSDQSDQSEIAELLARGHLPPFVPCAAASWLARGHLPPFVPYAAASWLFRGHLPPFVPYAAASAVVSRGFQPWGEWGFEIFFECFPDGRMCCLWFHGRGSCRHGFGCRAESSGKNAPRGRFLALCDECCGSCHNETGDVATFQAALPRSALFHPRRDMCCPCLPSLPENHKANLRKETPERSQFSAYRSMRRRSPGSFYPQVHADLRRFGRILRSRNIEEPMGMCGRITIKEPHGRRKL